MKFYTALFLFVMFFSSTNSFARLPEKIFSNPWVLHYRYTEAYKQSARFTTLRFFMDGTCSSTKTSFCTWKENGDQFEVEFKTNVHGEIKKGNAFSSSVILKDRMTGDFKKGSGEKAGQWLLVEDQHNNFYELQNFTSIWESWTLSYRFNTASDWVRIPMKMNFDSTCSSDLGTTACDWFQFAEAAGFWFELEGQKINFQTIFGPSDRNPSGVMVSESNEVLGSWVLF